MVVFRKVSSVFFGILILHNANTLFLFPLIGASLYQAYLEQGIRFRENEWLGNEPILKEYDFVVVGAGSGGSVVANRLTENPDWKVLLLEAGGDETAYTDIPVTAAHWSLPESDYNWNYHAERTGNACLAMENEQCPWPRGKGLGGCSILNYMIYTRGHREDYDGYAAAGNEGWSYDEVLPYFIKSENNSIPEYRNSHIHGHGGYMHVERIRHSTALIDAFLKGGEELGYKKVDYTEPDTNRGFSRIQTTQKNGRRMSAATAYLKSIKNRPNLHTAIFSRVTKILIDASTKRALGVEFIKNKRKRVVFARKETIVSAGALNSPQLLMLSGIGPREHLEKLGIPVVQDLPVGENLQEHYTFVGMAFLVNQTGSSLVRNRLNLNSFIEWLNRGRGVLTVPGGVEGIGYTSTKQNTKSYPDMEFIFTGGSFASDGGTTSRRSFGLQKCMYDQVFGPATNKDTWTILPMPLHPRTRGRILLRDRNPWNSPKFYYNYFDNEHDLKVMVEGIKETIKLSETEAFRKLGTRLVPTKLAQCSKHPFKSDDYWACMARYFTATLHHQCGTCKMGPPGDKTAVVDPQLRVYGIKNLRVVDSSIFPYVPGAHLYAPTMMVGEKASDMIKSSWKSTSENAPSTKYPPYEEASHAQSSVSPCSDQAVPSISTRN